MVKIVSDVPYLKLYRGGTYQPRWEPGPKLRALGLKGQALRDTSGTWLPLEAAIARAQALNEEAARLEATGQRHRVGIVRRHPQCATRLWELYSTSPKFMRLAPKTQIDYRNRAGIFLAKFGDVPVAAIAHTHLYAWWEQLHKERGHAMANGTLAVARLLFSYARRKGWLKDNPARELGIESVPPRVVIWLASECQAFLEKADGMGLAPVGDAFLLALHTGQRLADTLELVEDRIVDNRIHFRQLKTNARVKVPLTTQLAQRLAAIRERRASSQAVVHLSNARRVVLCHDAEPYTTKHFNTHFRRVREAVAKDYSDAAQREFRDLRDTAITRLALAGATIAEIRAITGHTIKSVHQVLEHYMALDEAMADRAIERLQAWMTEQGIAV